MIQNYIGVRVPASYISEKSWNEIKRPAGMNQIIYMANKFPSSRQLDDLESSLNSDQCILIFNPDDTLRYMGRK